jgi:LMBR1 domain-containing protein 1
MPSNDNNDKWINSEEEIIDDDESMFNSCQINNKNIEIMVSFIINAIGILNIISNLYFMLYGGVGLLSLPIDLLHSFCARPERVLIKNSFDHEQKKEEIALFAIDLKGICMKLKKAEINGDNKKCICSKSRLKYENLLKQLKICVSIIEDQYEKINFKSTENKNGAIGYLMTFFLGIFSLILSIIWILHIIFYIILKKNEKPFFNVLNVILIKLTKINLSFVSIGIYFLLSLYLLFITIKGNFKIRSRIFYLGIIYPLKKNNSYMNSILFNVKLIMITSISVVQLFLRAFSDYTSMTDASLIFNVQIKYLLINGYLCKFNIVEYGLFSMAIISFIYFIISSNEMDRMKKLIYMKQLDVVLFDKNNEERFIISPDED